MKRYDFSFTRHDRSGCPCKGCDTRSPGCHGKCKAYTTWAEKKRIENEKESAEERARGATRWFLHIQNQQNRYKR